MTKSRSTVSVSTEQLLPLVRAALREPDAEIVDMTVRPLGWLNIMSGELYRAAGTASVSRVQGSSDWAVILKSFRPPTAGAPAAEPSNWKHWRREVVVYTEGVLDDLAGGLTAPRCLGLIDLDDPSERDWFERRFMRCLDGIAAGWRTLVEFFLERGEQALTELRARSRTVGSSADAQIRRRVDLHG